MKVDIGAAYASSGTETAACFENAEAKAFFEGLLAPAASKERRAPSPTSDIGPEERSRQSQVDLLKNHVTSLLGTIEAQRHIIDKYRHAVTEHARKIGRLAGERDKAVAALDKCEHALKETAKRETRLAERLHELTHRQPGPGPLHAGMPEVDMSVLHEASASISSNGRPSAPTAEASIAGELTAEENFIKALAHAQGGSITDLPHVPQHMRGSKTGAPAADKPIGGVLAERVAAVFQPSVTQASQGPAQQAEPHLASDWKEPISLAEQVDALSKVLKGVDGRLAAVERLQRDALARAVRS